jgi:hypothetical protein
MTHAEIIRTHKQLFIEVVLNSEVVGEGVEALNLYHGCLASCAKSLSANELRKTLADCKSQLIELGEDNVPPAFNEIVDELKRTMSERGVSIHPFTEEEKNRLRNVIDKLQGGDSPKK